MTVRGENFAEENVATLRVHSLLARVGHCHKDHETINKTARRKS